MRSLAATALSLAIACVIGVAARAQNTPPRFVGLTHPCGSSLAYTLGVPLQFRVRADDPDSRDQVVLTQLGAPPGMSFTPPLPIQGNPVESVATWTPTTMGGIVRIVFQATDGQATTSCRIDLVPGGECYLVFGGARADVPISPEGDRLYVVPFVFLPVTMSQIPRLPIPADAALLGRRLYSQVLMHNPFAFPQDAIQASNGLEIVLGIGVTAYGDHTGIEHWVAQPPLLGGVLDPRFRVKGM